MLKFALLASADVSTAGYVVEALLAAGQKPAATVLDTHPTNARDIALHQDRTGGRLPLRPIRDYAEEIGEIRTFEHHNGSDCIDYIAGLDVDFLVNAGTPRILRPPILAAAGGILNCHPGLLPWFRGSGAVEWALLLNEPVGNTIHLMNEGIDEGPIFATQQTAVATGDTYQDVRVRVFNEGFSLLSRVVRDLAEGRLRLGDAQQQRHGRHFRPPSPEQVAKAIERLNSGSYDGSAPIGADLSYAQGR